jgi:histidinol-phosphate aminotransferase
MKAPYNISSPASALAMRALSPEGLAVMKRNVDDILHQRSLLVQVLQQLEKSREPGKSGIGTIIGGFDANFILVRILNENGEPCNKTAESLYKLLAEKMGVVVRFRGSERNCTGALRITVGTAQEMRTLLFRLQEWQSQ